MTTHLTRRACLHCLMGGALGTGTGPVFAHAAGTRTVDDTWVDVARRRGVPVKVR